MSRDNFRRCVDSDGKMPVLSRSNRPIPNRPYYIRYENNKPVALRGPVEVLASDVSGTKVYDYDLNEYVPIDGIPQE